MSGIFRNDWHNRWVEGGGHKFHKIAIYFSFEVRRKEIWENFLRITELFTQKTVTKL